MSIKDQEFQKQIDTISNHPEWNTTRKQVEAGKAAREAVSRLKDEGKSNAEIADLLGIPESSVRYNVEPKDIQDHETIWFPGIYGGRQYKPWTKTVQEVSLNRLVALVQRRAKQDGEWSIENGLVGDNEPKMRKMMAWVSDPVNIEQCVGHILKEKMEGERTIDFVCRDLANGSKWVAGG